MFWGNICSTEYEFIALAPRDWTHDINNRNQTQASYLSRYVRRDRKRRSKVPVSSWNLSNTAGFDQIERTDLACGALLLLAEVAETLKVSSEREESSALRVRHGFLKSSRWEWSHFDILHGNFCWCCAMRARLRNCALELGGNSRRLYQRFYPS